MTAGVETAEVEAILRQILASLEDDKAEDVVTIPLAGKSEMADYMVVCSGRLVAPGRRDLGKAG